MTNTLNKIEFGELADQVKKQINHLESVRDQFYKDGNGGQLHNILVTLKQKNYAFNNSMETILQYKDLESIQKEIKELEDIPTILTKSLIQ